MIHLLLPDYGAASQSAFADTGRLGPLGGQSTMDRGFPRPIRRALWLLHDGFHLHSSCRKRRHWTNNASRTHRIGGRSCHRGSARAASMESASSGRRRRFGHAPFLHAATAGDKPALLYRKCTTMQASALAGCKIFGFWDEFRIIGIG